MLKSCLLRLFPTQLSYRHNDDSVSLDALLEAHSDFKEVYENYTEEQLEEVETCCCVLVTGKDQQEVIRLLRDGNTGIIYLKGTMGTVDKFYESVPVFYNNVIAYLSKYESYLTPCLKLEIQEKQGLHKGLFIKELAFFYFIEINKDTVPTGMAAFRDRVYFGDSLYCQRNCEYTILAQALNDYDMVETVPPIKSDEGYNVSAEFSSREFDEKHGDDIVNYREYNFIVNKYPDTLHVNVFDSLDGPQLNVDEVKDRLLKDHIVKFTVTLRNDNGDTNTFESNLPMLEAIGKVLMKFDEARLIGDYSYLVKIFDKAHIFGTINLKDLKTFNMFFELCPTC